MPQLEPFIYTTHMTKNEISPKLGLTTNLSCNSSWPGIHQQAFSSYTNCLRFHSHIHQGFLEHTMRGTMSTSILFLQKITPPFHKSNLPPLEHISSEKVALEKNLRYRHLARASFDRPAEVRDGTPQVEPVMSPGTRGTVRGSGAEYTEFFLTTEV